MVKYPNRHFEKFVLFGKSVGKVFDFTDKDNVKFLPHYADELLMRFADHILGVYTCKGKDERSSKVVSVRIQCDGAKCKKAFRIIASRFDLSRDTDLCWSVESDDIVCDHAGEAPRTRNFSGNRRKELKDLLGTKTTRTVYREMVEKDDMLKVQQGVTGKLKYLSQNYFL